VSLTGAVIVSQEDANRRYYGKTVTPTAILNGNAAAPAGAHRLISAAE